MGKQASVWNTNEEENFLQRQTQKTKWHSVDFAKSPNSNMSKPDIPCDKQYGHPKNPKKYRLPIFSKRYPMVET